MSIFFNKKSSTPDFKATETEVDGFILIGETKEERETVRPDDEINKEMPPTYEVATTPVNTGPEQVHQPSSTIDLPEYNLINSQSMRQMNEDSDTLNGKSSVAVKDIPFQFAASVSNSVHRTRITHNVETTMTNMWNRASSNTTCNYDFTVEHDVLK